MIEIVQVSKTYGRKQIIDDVSITLKSGKLISIIGPNGAGKSTLLALISRLIPMDKGTILVNGMDVSTTLGNELARCLSILRQNNIIPLRLTVRELVSFGRYPYSKGRLTPEDHIHIDQAIHYFGLKNLQKRFLDELSGGQCQRAFVAMVICQNTEYILLDEPLNNLDLNHSVAIMKLLRCAVDELDKTIIVVLHDINCASCYSDMIVAMRDGKIIANGVPEIIIQPDLLREIYQMDIKVRKIDNRRIAIYYS